MRNSGKMSIPELSVPLFNYATHRRNYAPQKIAILSTKVFDHRLFRSLALLVKFYNILSWMLLYNSIYISFFPTVFPFILYPYIQRSLLNSHLTSKIQLILFQLQLYFCHCMHPHPISLAQEKYRRQFS